MLVSASFREDIVDLLKTSGALREGHFVLPNGEHTATYYQLPLALRQLSTWRILTVGLSRVLRLTREVSSILPHATIVAPASGGIPVAFGVREALSAERIVWVERAHHDDLRFRQFASVRPGDKCVLVDDLLITGRTLVKLIDLIRAAGAEVVAVGVLVDGRVLEVDLKGVPLYALVTIDTKRHAPSDCPECRAGLPSIAVEF